MRFRHFCIAAAFVVALTASGHAQPASTGPAPANGFAGKAVALYVSKRNFSFSEAYYIPVGGFLQRQDTLGLTQEDIHLGATVKLGNYLAHQIRHALNADSVVFVNAVPGLSQAFVGSYAANRLDYGAVAGALPANLDYVVTLDSLAMGTDLRTSVYTISNELYTERRRVRVADLLLRVYDVRKRGAVQTLRLRFDEDAAPRRTAYYRPQPSATPLEVLLDYLLNEANFRIWNGA